MSCLCWAQFTNSTSHPSTPTCKCLSTVFGPKQRVMAFERTESWKQHKKYPIYFVLLFSSAPFNLFIFSADSCYNKFLFSFFPFLQFIFLFPHCRFLLLLLYPLIHLHFFVSTILIFICILVIFIFF
jgi:hypothetical protein